MRSKILILKTGELPRQVTQRHGPYEQAFINLLGEEERLVVADARKEPLPEPEYRGVIVTGSASSVYDGNKWIRKSEDFLRRMADREIPIYGICFGHQLVAQAFGGRVERCPQGWELGTASISLNPAGRNDPLFTGLPVEFSAQQTHGDVVTELPAGAISLAQNSHWHIQAFKLGERIWGTQFHPEFTPGIMAGLVHSLTSVLPPEVFPNCPADGPVKDWFLSNLRDTPQAQGCLRNFVKLVRRIEGTTR